MFVIYFDFELFFQQKNTRSIDIVLINFANFNQNS